MCIPCGKTFSSVPRWRLSVKVKVKYQDYILEKMVATGALVFSKHSLFSSSAARDKKLSKLMSYLLFQFIYKPNQKLVKKGSEWETDMKNRVYHWYVVFF